MNNDHILDGVIKSSRNEELFNDDLIDDFNPPPIIKNSSILEQTPVIKFVTPIRKRAYVEREDIDEIFKVTKNLEKRSPIRTPVPDLSDEDEINDRVRCLINKSHDVVYEKEDETVKELCLESFRVKFQNLVINYPDYNIEFPETKSLDKIHKYYHEIVKSIYVNMNLGQTQLGYILFLMVIEFICVKAFNLPMAGFTKIELKRMYKYNFLMIELGEAFYPTGGGTPSPIEWRIASTIGWNIVIFLGIKIISNYIGGETMVNVTREIIDQLMDNPITKENIESGEAKNMDKSSSGIGGIFDGLLSGDGTSEIADLISNIGTSFTENLESGKKGKSGKKKNRVIFNT